MMELDTDALVDGRHLEEHLLVHVCRGQPHRQAVLVTLISLSGELGVPRES